MNYSEKLLLRAFRWYKKNLTIVLLLLLVALICISIFGYVLDKDFRAIVLKAFNAKDSSLVVLIAITISGTYLSLNKVLPSIAKFVEVGFPIDSKTKTRDPILEMNRALQQQKAIEADIERLKIRMEYANYNEALKEDHLTEEQMKLQMIEEHVEPLQDDITNQIDKISRSGTINLLIGLLLTVVAIVLLIIVIFSPGAVIDFADSKSTQWDKLFIHMVPRLSIVIFIEFFSFFFLNLYKRNNDEIKYFNNEKTNIESKILALKMAIIYGDRISISKTIDALNKVDRNSTLKKGETTIELEKLKYDKSSLDNAIDAFSKMGKIFAKGND